MKRLATLMLAFGFGFCLTANAMAENATKEECVAKCKEAALMVKKDKDAGIAEINKKDGKFAWKDSYVFLMDTNGKMLAHPMSPALLEKASVMDLTDKNPEKPKQIFAEFADIAKSKGEGWSDYMWPKPGEEKPSLKQTYIMKVEGTNMLVGAGIYK